MQVPLLAEACKKMVQGNPGTQEYAKWIRISIGEYEVPAPLKVELNLHAPVSQGILASEFLVRFSNPGGYFHIHIRFCFVFQRPRVSHIQMRYFSYGQVPQRISSIEFESIFMFQRFRVFSIRLQMFQKHFQRKWTGRYIWSTFLMTWHALGKRQAIFSGCEGVVPVWGGMSVLRDGGSGHSLPVSPMPAHFQTEGSKKSVGVGQHILWDLARKNVDFRELKQHPGRNFLPNQFFYDFLWF